MDCLLFYYGDVGSFFMVSIERHRLLQPHNIPNAPVKADCSWDCVLQLLAYFSDHLCVRQQDRYDNVEFFCLFLGWQRGAKS